jgi:hypothetical protein
MTIVTTLPNIYKFVPALGMKKTASIFLLLLLLLNTAGYFPLFRYLQSEIRSEVKTRIKLGVPEQQLCRIVFDDEASVDWVKDGKEFRLDNRMFDVVRTETSRGKLIFYCINDLQEEALFAGLDEIIKKQMNDPRDTHGKSAKTIADSFNKIFITTSLSLSLLPFSIELFGFNPEFFVVPGYPGTETPPPDLG